ncbi:membrane protease YdiL (CAAX protease family) [Streptococcus gallinaceus]|uniref:CPBP family intramembrane glutamic endopeptidase n=1 Tax=Streptococcus gallinaceus TaxID=165758 RepID=UPI00209E2BB6|nr:CPBP family intramembrane glutamic endopeptidase [Streptococcus gallinaceus]MCP1638551.1 membrane protease YdiL (CAAX protease family) [Streptococcus gallinaceus]MCP1769362.1 membrane protease YdiL (CAAX protease family) [Streptococcus gallinaceus]
MKKIISSSLLLILWLFLYILSSGLMQVGPHMRGLPFLVWGMTVIGIMLLSLLIWFYHYIYKGMKCDLSGLDAKFQKVWGPIVLYVLFMVLQVLFPVKAGTNQRALIDIIQAVPIPAFFNTVIFAPILEEYIFRGMLRGYFFPEIASMRQAIVYCLVSASFFSLLHMPNTPIHFLIYGTMGFAFSWLYLAKDDLRYPIGLHMANNLLAFVSILLV